MIPLLRLRRCRRTAISDHPANRLPVAWEGFAAAATRAALLLGALFLAAPAQAQEGVAVNADVDYRLVALRVAEDFVEPRYSVLFTRALAQKEAWNAFCSAPPSDAAFEQLQVQFKNAVMAWSNVEILRYGPVSEDFLYERIAYWPERRNDVERGLSTLLSGDDTLTPEAMFAKSVAVQGLPALERLLYGEGARAALFVDDAGARRRCDAGIAISSNVEQLARRIRDLWPKLKDRLRQDDASPAREAVSRIATDLLTVYQIVGDLKLDKVTGASPDEARPRSAQWWRSGLSNEAMAYNLKSAADLIWLFLGPGQERQSLMIAIGTAERTARDLPAPLPDMAGDEAARSRLILLRNMVSSARDLSASYVPPKLGIMIGFNSLDGD